MKEKTKDNKGITLVALVITIVLMMILGSVTAYSGIKSYKHTKTTRFVTYMQLLQAKVDDLIASKTVEDLNNMGLNLPTTNEQINSLNLAFENKEISANDPNKYKVFTVENILNILDVEDAKNEIMVNIETREIVDLKGVEHRGKRYYTQYKLPNGQTIIKQESNLRNLSFIPEVLIDGINSTIILKNISITNGTLSYKEKNSNYVQTITNYTEKGKEYRTNISKTGTYIFKLQDNTNNNYEESEIIITLANKPKTSLNLELYNYGASSEKWAYANKGGISYVWIPRFAYKTNADNSIEIKFIKGNSNIATDNTYIDEKDWIVHSKFKNFTGVWVESKKSATLNMIELLNNSTVLETI